MTRDEGVIKYKSDWTMGPAADAALIHELDTWRTPLFDAGLIGHDAESDIGYGNISLRVGETPQFVISGTQTGHIRSTNAAHYTLVTSYDIDANRVSCKGPAKASSEAMTHAAIYELDPGIRAIVHVHSRSLWRTHLSKLPTTRVEVAYGTPGMAKEFGRLYRESDFGTIGIALMAGHEDGAVSIGETLEQASRRILRAFRSLQG